MIQYRTSRPEGRAILQRFFYSALVCVGVAWSAPAELPNIIVILTDDHGYADLGCQNIDPNVRTPNIDALAARGVRCTAAYVTAPQCSPSRAAILTGRYQQRFGIETIASLPLPREQTTLAQHLQRAGYRTGIVGKWHLASSGKEGIQRRARGIPVPFTERGDMAEAYYDYYPQFFGFQQFLAGRAPHLWGNFRIDGASAKADGEWQLVKGDRADIATEAARAFIRSAEDDPFFLYLAYDIPHAPLEATTERINRIATDLPHDRRMGLAMLLGVDDGVGAIVEELRARDALDNTLIFFLSDHGATYPTSGPNGPKAGWNGSLNTPYRGGKGMLTEGALRVPFIVSWPKRLPAGTTYHASVSALDIAATSLAAAELPAKLDGVDLAPRFSGNAQADPHDALYWRFRDQAAIREGPWKYIVLGGGGRYLFDFRVLDAESRNLVERHPDIAARLHDKLENWTRELPRSGLPEIALSPKDRARYLTAVGPAR